MAEVSTRDILQDLATKPIGSRQLQGEADRIARTQSPASPELKETVKRAAKIWLPQGRSSPVRGACNNPEAEQTDIEDAVEAAGGSRGGKAA